MRALLNSLGLSLWWATAIILAAGMALVGYRVSLGLKTPALIFPNASPAPAAGGGDTSRLGKRERWGRRRAGTRAQRWAHSACASSIPIH
jgi:hypothetical protein